MLLNYGWCCLIWSVFCSEYALTSKLQKYTEKDRVQLDEKQNPQVYPTLQQYLLICKQTHGSKQNSRNEFIWSNTEQEDWSQDSSPK
jgi:hypothetical protein